MQVDVRYIMAAHRSYYGNCPEPTGIGLLYVYLSRLSSAREGVPLFFGRDISVVRNSAGEQQGIIFGNNTQRPARR